MIGFSYTEILVDIDRKFKSGNRAAGRETFYRYLPLLRLPRPEEGCPPGAGQDENIRGIIN